MALAAVRRAPARPPSRPASPRRGAERRPPSTSSTATRSWPSAPRGELAARRSSPRRQRALNLVELDAATSPAEVAAEVATGGLFGARAQGGAGRRSRAFLAASKEDSAEQFDGAARAWREGRQREAARRLLASRRQGGRRRSSHDPWPGWQRLAPRERRGSLARLGVALGAGGEALRRRGGALRAASAELKVAKGGDGGVLEARARPRLAAEGHVLILAAGKVDGRLPLVKRLASRGEARRLRIETEGAWDAQRLVLAPGAGGAPRRHRQGVDPAARRGSRSSWATTRARSPARWRSWSPTRASGRRSPRPTWTRWWRGRRRPLLRARQRGRGARPSAGPGVVDRSLADGASPFMFSDGSPPRCGGWWWSASAARRVAGGRRISSFGAWQRRVLPTVPREELGAKKPYGFWMKYQAAQRYSRGALLGALADRPTPTWP